MVRSKIGWILLALTGIFLISARGVKAVPLDISGIVFQDANADGRRDADEPALPQVVLSDGVQVVQTDRWGRYRLSTESSRVLFVCLPGRYLANGDFYEQLRTHRDGDKVDFPLVEHPWTDSFTFLFFTDSQIGRAHV